MQQKDRSGTLSENDADARDIVEDFLGAAHDDPRAHLQREIAEALDRAFERGKDVGHEKGHEEGYDDGKKDTERQYAKSAAVESALIEMVRDLSGRVTIGDADVALEWLREERDRRHREHIEALRSKRAA